MTSCGAHRVQQAVLEQELARLEAANRAAFAERMRLAIRLAALEAVRATLGAMSREALVRLGGGEDVAAGYVEGMQAAQAEADRLLSMLGAIE